MHKLDPVIWKKLPKLTISNKPIKNQFTHMAKVYRSLLFRKIPLRPNSAGWLLLSYKNYIHNHNTFVASPSQLGFMVISPVSNYKQYLNNIIRYVRDGSIVITSCVTRRGSFYIETTLKNTTDKIIKVDFVLGQVFTQKREGGGIFQNGSVKGDWKDYKNDAEGFNSKFKNWSKIKSEDKYDLQEYDDFTTTYVLQPKNKPGDTAIVQLYCNCIDRDLLTPTDGKDAYITPFVDLPTILAFGNEEKAWIAREQYKNQMDPNNPSDVEIDPPPVQFE